MRRRPDIIWVAGAAGRMLRAAPAFLVFVFCLAVFAFAFSMPARAGCGDPEDSLVGWWKLDDGSGSTAVDSSGQGNNGTLSNSPTWTTGRIGGAINLNGVNQYASVPEASSLDLSGSWTVSGWIDLAALPAQYYAATIIQKLDGVGDSNYVLYLNNGGLFSAMGWAVSFYDSSHGLHTADYVTTPGTSTWYFVAGSWDGTNLDLYLNGVLVGSSVPGATPNATAGPYGPFLGHDNGAGFVNGELDDVRVYNRALSAVEVKNLYNARYAGDVLFNGDSRVVQFCDGNNWVGMGPPQATPFSTKISGPSGSVAFGSALSISGSILAVGANATTVGGNTKQGEVYIYDISNPISPVQKAVITASDGAAYDQFGSSLAVAGNTLVVGASNKTVGGNAQQGEVYVFDISNPSLPVQKAIITSSDGAAGDQFGSSIAAAGNIAVIGAARKTVGGNTNEGEGYIYDISTPSSPVQDAIINPSDAKAWDDYGWSVAIAGNLAFIGAINKVAIYDISTPTAPVQKATIQSIGGNGLAAAGNILAAGYTVGGSTPNVEYIYDISTPSSPVQDAIITDPGSSTYDNFGASAAISGNFLVVGAPQTVVQGQAQAGATYIYDISNPSAPVQVAAIPGQALGNDFGFGVLFQGNILYVGTGYENSFYIYDGFCANPTGWAGDMKYNHDYHVVQYCDGTNWHPMGPVTSSGGSGCSSPTGTGGQMKYNSDHHVVQYCNDTNWVAAGGGLAVAPEGGLVGWWKLDDGSGTTAADSSGNGNTGALVASPTWTTGKINGALSFNGSTAYVNVADTASLDIAGSWTVSAWLKPAAIPGGGSSGRAVNRDDSATNTNYGISIDSTDNCSGLSWRVYFNNTGGSSASACYVTAISTGTWYLVTGTWNGTTLTLYLNGVSVATSVPGIVPVSDGGGSFTLGHEPCCEYYNGSIDDSRVYNRALSATEIWNLYLATGGT